MTILDELLDSLDDDAPVHAVWVGVHWTYVCSRYGGLASTLSWEPTPHGHSVVRDVGHLHEKSARELAEFSRSADPLEVSIGFAAINSLLAVDESRSVEINAAEVLAERGREKNVALIGHFPFIPKLREAVGNLWVIEQHPIEGEHPASAAADLLSQADLVAITGTALMNQTLDNLLTYCHPAATVMILGPSTPLSSVLFKHGVTYLSGARVIDEAAALRTIGQAASFKQVAGVKLLTIERPLESR